MRRGTVSAAGVLALSATLLGGCGDDAEGPVEEPEVATEEVTEEPVEETDAAGADETEDAADADAGTGDDATVMDATEILEDPSAFAGQDVTFEGQVDEVLEAGLFTVASSDASQDPLLVATEGAEVQEGQDVTIEGTLNESFSVQEVEEFLGGLDLDDPQFERFANEPFVEAETVE